MKIDAFCHIMPRPYHDRFFELEATEHSANLRKRVSNIPCLVDMDVRFAQMDEFGDYRQIINIAAPPVEGARLPHIWLDDGTAIADHLGRCFTLLKAPGAGAAVAELARAFARTGAPFATSEMRSAATGPGYEDHSLILVRPDLHVVWRGRDNGRDELPNPDALAALATGNVTREGQLVAEGQGAR